MFSVLYVHICKHSGVVNLHEDFVNGYLYNPMDADSCLSSGRKSAADVSDPEAAVPTISKFRQVCVFLRKIKFSRGYCHDT